MTENGHGVRPGWNSLPPAARDPSQTLTQLCALCAHLTTFEFNTYSKTLCLKKTSPMFLAITRKSIVGFS